MWKEVNLLSTNFSAKHTPSATLKYHSSHTLVLFDHFVNILIPKLSSLVDQQFVGQLFGHSKFLMFEGLTFMMSFNLSYVEVCNSPLKVKNNFFCEFTMRHYIAWPHYLLIWWYWEIFRYPEFWEREKKINEKWLGLPNFIHRCACIFF